MLKSILPISFLFFSSVVFCQWDVKHVNVDSPRTIQEIQFLTSGNGYAMGDDGLILFSNDSGESWEEVNHNIEYDITDFAFINNAIIITTLEFSNNISAQVFKSTDGGSTWSEVHGSQAEFPTIESKDGVAFLGGSEKLFRSADEGAEWDEVFDLKANGFDWGHIRDFSIVDESLAYAVGNGKKNQTFVSFILQTFDHGLSWEIVAEFEDVYTNTIHFVNEDLGYILSEEFTFKITNNGATWEALDNLWGPVDIVTPTEEKIITVNRPAAYILEGEIITEFAISNSNDQGENWTGEYEKGAHLESIFFVNDSTGFVAGDYSLIMKTTSCGGRIQGDYPWYLFDPNANKDFVVEEVDVYPNPCVDQLHVEADYSSDWNYKIITPDGSLILEGELGSHIIDTSNLPTGLYYLKLEKQDHQSFTKFFKVN